MCLLKIDESNIVRGFVTTACIETQTSTHNNLSSLLGLNEEFINNFNRIFSYIFFFISVCNVKCETGSFILCCLRRFVNSSHRRFFFVFVCVASTQKRNFMHSAISYFHHPMRRTRPHLSWREYFNAYRVLHKKLCSHFRLRDKSLQIFLNRCHLFTTPPPPPSKKNKIKNLLKSNERKGCEGKEKMTWLSWGKIKMEMTKKKQQRESIDGNLLI